MHVAAQCGRVEAQYERVEVVKVLCEQGANINMTNDVSWHSPVVV